MYKYIQKTHFFILVINQQLKLLLSKTYATLKLNLVELLEINYYLSVSAFKNFNSKKKNYAVFV